MRARTLEVIEIFKVKRPTREQYLRACGYMGIDPWTNPNFSVEERKRILGINPGCKNPVMFEGALDASARRERYCKLECSLRCEGNKTKGRVR